MLSERKETVRFAKTGIGQQHVKIPDGAFNLTGRRSARRVLKTDMKKNQEEYEWSNDTTTWNDLWLFGCTECCVCFVWFCFTFRLCVCGEMWPTKCCDFSIIFSRTKSMCQTPHRIPWLVRWMERKRTDILHCCLILLKRAGHVWHGYSVVVDYFDVRKYGKTFHFIRNLPISLRQAVRHGERGVLSPFWPLHATIWCYGWNGNSIKHAIIMHKRASERH